MMAWMNAEAVARTLATGRVTYWSRSRQAFWVKGETSGHVQELVEMRVDCDRDCLLVLVRQTGPGLPHQPAGVFLHRRAGRAEVELMAPEAWPRRRPRRTGGRTSPCRGGPARCRRYSVTGLRGRDLDLPRGPAGPRRFRRIGRAWRRRSDVDRRGPCRGAARRPSGRRSPGRGGIGRGRCRDRPRHRGRSGSARLPAGRSGGGDVAAVAGAGIEQAARPEPVERGGIGRQRSDCRITGASQVRPSQCRSSKISASHSGRARSGRYPRS
jgi:phosphoribosyl-AMP cyclohydrolase